MTARLRRSVFSGWPCGGSQVQSVEEGLSVAGSCGPGDEGGKLLGDGTAGGGGGWGLSACGSSSGSAVFSSSCSPSPSSASLPAVGSA